MNDMTSDDKAITEIYNVIHEECNYQCRISNILQSMDQYPSLLARVDDHGCLLLHLVLQNHNSLIEDALLMIDKYPASLRHSNHQHYLPLHLECKFQCRSTIISRCIELYPEALAIANSQGNLPLHLLLVSSRSLVDDVLMMIEQYPAALQNPNDKAELPLLLECKYQRRSMIISRCIELYPDALAKADCQGHLPLHVSLWMTASSIDTLAIIDKYPEAVRHVSKNGSLPLHLECIQGCRSAVILNLIKVYPEALTMVDHQGRLPLHYCLINHNGSNIEDLPVILEKYPVALIYPDGHGNLLIHIECLKRCRLSVIRKLIKLYPESLEIVNDEGKNSIAIILERIYDLWNPTNAYDYIHVLSYLANANPFVYVNSIQNPRFHYFDNLPSDVDCRILLNLAADDLLDEEYRRQKQDLNWIMRLAMISLLLQLQMKIKLKVKQQSAAADLSFSCIPRDGPSSFKPTIRTLLCSMIKRSSQADVSGYAICQGDELGDHILRHVISYL
jgi:ankyrin repeat protein